jgi:hypothetical protein
VELHREDSFTAGKLSGHLEGASEAASPCASSERKREIIQNQLSLVSD